LNAPDSRIAILILGSEKVIHITGNDEVTLGRFTKGQTIIPDIDLSPFQAYEAGVSRLHANIDIKNSEITIKDLGSANGTRLNGMRIQPHQAYQIKHGDVLTFGRLKVQVLIKE
jgi:pSer/pThr/pTyr-binding forkhead associated (FHA) protein